MDPCVMIPPLVYNPHQRPVLLKDEDLAPGSGSSSDETELGSEPKRQRLLRDEAAVGDKSSDQVMSDDGGGSGSGSEEEEVEKKLWRFYQQLSDSEGFDFDEYPRAGFNAMQVVPVNMKSASARYVNACLDHVVNEQNAKQDGVLKLEGAEVVKANRRPCQGNNFFITFKATNSLRTDPEDAREKVIYQAVVWQNFNGAKETHLLRVKGQKGAILDHPDRDKPFVDLSDCDCEGDCDCM